MVSVFVFYLLFSNQVDSVAFFLIVHQGAVDVSLFLRILQLVACHRFRVFLAREWDDLPSLVNVVSLRHSKPLDGNIKPHFHWTLEDLRKPSLHASGFKVARHPDTL